MQRLLIILIIFSFFKPVLLSQDSDSLYRIWQDETQPDSIRADAFYDHIYDRYYYNAPDSALILSKDLIRFTNQNGLQEHSVDANRLAGYLSFRTGAYPEALQFYRDGLELAREIRDSFGQASILLRTGYVYHDNEDHVTALKYYEQSEKIFKAMDDIQGLGSIYNEYGSIYLAKSEFDLALDNYLKGIALNEQVGDTSNSAIYTNIGNVYLAKLEYDRALEYYQRALAIDEALGDKLAIASILAGMGAVYAAQGRDSEALEILNRSLHISEEISDIQGSATTLLDMADIYADRDDHRRAIDYCQQSLARATEIGDLGNQRSACEYLYLSHKALGNTREALLQLEKMMLLEDSIKSEAASVKLQQMAFAKQVMADSLAQVEKDFQVEMAHQEEVRRKDRNRNIAIGSGLFFLLLAGGFFSRWRYVQKSKRIIEKERDRSDRLLLNILPAEIADELKEKGSTTARDFDIVSILFTDFKGFTEKSATLTATELLAEINDCFKAFDMICEKYKIEKIKTIGDAYMAAGGLPTPAEDSIARTILAALEMQDFTKRRYAQRQEQHQVAFEMRLGIHTGPVVAGIVGVKKFQYDVWGDTVNTAARMETAGEIGKVNISQDTYLKVKDDPRFQFEKRGLIDVKGKGELAMWFVDLS